MTPEGKIKAKVRKILDKFGSRVYYEMPVPGGYGKSGLDFHGCAGGVYFAVETKAHLKDEPTDRQKACIRKIEAAGGKCFVVAGPDSVALYNLEEWVKWKVGPPDAG